jgi:hypothetical protein
MKVLTVKNPWAWLIIHGGKDIENRVRKTNFRGRIAIHASKQSDELAYQWPMACRSELRGIFKEVRERREEIEKLNGHIIGGVELYNCTYYTHTKISYTGPWAEEWDWQYWLRDPVALPEPIAAKGMLGLWEYENLGEIIEEDI